MACASQSALDYVRSARDHLVRTLKGFTEIVENLSTRGFFSEEDVNKIKSESDGFDKTRRIVDYVIEMGEEACYEFLRIIDTTRRTSGERSLSFAENPESSSSLSNMFDLNYWISCFSFREDINMDVQGPSPCHRYQQKLKFKAQKISERSWTQSKAVLFNKETSLSYTSLVLDTPGQASPSKIKKSKIKKSRKLRPKKLKTYIPEDKHGTSPSELLKTYERKILLVGKPGTGKTAVVHQMLKLWSEKDNRGLDYMSYFDMREAPNITEVHKLEDLLFSVFCEPDEGNDEVLEDIKNNADSVTIIFDGFTDVGSTSVVFKLIQKTLLPEAKIIITCRPEVESADFLLDWDCLRVEVKGFSEQGIREYLSKNLSENHLNKVLCNLELFSLCHVPMYALMVVACFSFEGSDFSPHPCTVTEIYLNILHFCNQRNVSKTPENESTKWDAILSLSQAAFCATEGKNVSLTSLPKLDSCANLAILSKLLIQISPTVKKPLCAFLHYTVQEFFAALWVLKDPEKTRCVLQQCLVQGSKHMKHLVPFLCGLLNEKNTDLLEGLLPPQQLRDTSDWFFKHLVTTFVGCSDSEDCEVDLMFLCQCLYESQSPDACLCLLDKLDYCIDVSGETLDPQQCCVLAYVISQSQERKIELNLEDTTVSKQGMRPLLGCLSKLQRSDSLSRQLWTISLLSEVDVDYVSLLDFTENQLHLPVNSETQLYDRAVRVLQKRKRKVKVCLHCDHRVCQSASSFLLHHLPHIHSLSFCQSSGNLSDQTELLMNLFIVAADRQQRTGEKILNMLSSVCSYQTFPLHSHYNDKYQSDFLLDLCSHVKDCETKTGLSVLPSLQPVFQSAPAVWIINLSERKTSILLELLKLQPEKKQVELRGCSHEESEVRSLLQCLPFISQLSCGPEFFQSVCTSMSVRSREEAQQLESLLQLLGFQLLLTGALHRKSCWSVGRVLKLCGSKVDLILTPSKMSARGGALLFRHTTQLHSLRLSIDMSLLLSQWVRRGRAARRLAVEELSLVPKKARPSHRVLLRAVSSLASLLRYWTVGRLDLTETCIPAQGLIVLLLHHGPLTVKLSEESFQQLLSLLHETQDKDLTLSFLSKVGGDLTSCCLSWELLHYLLQQPSAPTITVDLRKNLFLQEETTRLLPFLDRIVFTRPSPSFVMSSIRELYRAHDSHAVPSLLRSLGHVISLSCRQLDSVDCAALIFILRHGDGVRLNLLWTSIPAGGVESILLMLDSVSRLSVDRNQLLRFIHCCAACDVQQEAASGLLRTLQHSLDLSCSSCVELPEEDQTEPLSLTADDCRAVSTILTQGSRDTQLDLRDCEVEDSVLDLLFPVLHRVRLRVSNTVLLQLLSLVPVNSERDAVRRAVSLCTALGGELDLSHSTLDQRVCGALVQMLDSCEGLTELDLSHCQLTDQLLLPLITHLHKVQVLDLSHNQITDASTDVLLQLLSINPSIHCVRLFSNNIVHRAAFKEHTQFEIW
uniref:NACHT domain-containing protein n=1 Tax=Astatotilapia calliptera TaxID=8154 RepID=A0AAX7SLN2_ASTCA